MIDTGAGGGGGGVPSPPLPLIRFDFGAAAELAAQLQGAAQALLTGRDLLQQVLPQTTETWTGSFRSAFDSSCVSILSGATLQSQTLLALAVQVQSRAEEAFAQDQLILHKNAEIATQRAALDQALVQATAQATSPAGGTP